MRFKEFTITEAEKPAFYVVGDSHAAGIAAVDKRWINMARIGAKTTDSIVNSIADIPEGSTVILSIGHS